MLQKMKDGRILLATGVPIFDEGHDEIVMVICTSKNVEELESKARGTMKKFQMDTDHVASFFNAPKVSYAR